MATITKTALKALVKSSGSVFFDKSHMRTSKLLTGGVASKSGGYWFVTADLKTVEDVSVWVYHVWYVQPNGRVAPLPILKCKSKSEALAGVHALKKNPKRNPTAAELELAKAYAEVAGPGKARVNPRKRKTRKKMSAKTKAYLKALKRKRLHSSPKRKKAKRKNAWSPMGPVTAVMPSVSAHLRPKIGHAPRASRGGASLTPRSSQISNPGVKALEHKLDTVLRALKKKSKSVVKKAKKARKASSNPAGYTLRYYSARGKLIGSQKARVSLATAKRAAKSHLGKTWLGRKIVKVQLSDGRK